MTHDIWQTILRLFQRLFRITMHFLLKFAGEKSIYLKNIDNVKENTCVDRLGIVHAEYILEYSKGGGIGMVQ